MDEFVREGFEISERNGFDVLIELVSKDCRSPPVFKEIRVGRRESGVESDDDLSVQPWTRNGDFWRCLPEGSCLACALTVPFLALIRTPCNEGFGICC